MQSEVDKNEVGTIPNIGVFFYLVIISNLGFNYLLIPSAKIYVSHLLTAFFFVLCSLFLLIKKRFVLQPITLISIIFFLLYAFFLESIFDGARFGPEFTKVTFFLISLYFFQLFFLNYRCSLETVFYSILIGVFISTFTMVDLGSFGSETAGGASRLVVSYGATVLDTNMGDGFNSFSITFALAILISMYIVNQSKSKIMKFIAYFLIAYFSVWLITTLSRGGMVALLFGGLVYGICSGSKKILIGGSVFFVTAVSLAIQYFDLWDIFSGRYFDLASIMQGSGRVELWRDLLGHFYSNPLSILFGFGIGTIDMSDSSIMAINAAHNMYLEIFYSVGIFFLILFLGIIINSFKNARKLKSLNDRALIITFVSVFAVMNLTDSHIMSSQLAWFFALMISIPCIANYRGYNTKK